MLIKRYEVKVIEPGLRARLAAAGEPTSWRIAANDLPAAWRKFAVQHFGVLLPNPADYDIRLHSTESAGAPV